jgi:light-regulated signal transduction histidine kinase (bacteriophytochrome)
MTDVALRQENEKLRRRLSESQNELQEMIYAISHDMGAPLRAVTQFSEILAEKYVGGLDAQGLAYFNFVRDGGQKAREMLNGLLDYSRILSRGKEFERVSLDVVFEKALARVSEKVGASGAEIRSSGLPVLSCDKEQLETLFVILLDNALTYVSSGVVPQIMVSSQRNAGGWSLSFKDNGIGVPVQSQDSIFQPFKRLHSDNKIPGKGMGLALAKRIVVRHDGTICVISDGLSGSDFVITLGEQADELKAE